MSHSYAMGKVTISEHQNRGGQKKSHRFSMDLEKCVCAKSGTALRSQEWRRSMRQWCRTCLRTVRGVRSWPDPVNPGLSHKRRWNGNKITQVKKRPHQKKKTKSEIKPNTLSDELESKASTHLFCTDDFCICHKGAALSGVIFSAPSRDHKWCFTL